MRNYEIDILIYISYIILTLCLFSKKYKFNKPTKIIFQVQLQTQYHNISKESISNLRKAYMNSADYVKVGSLLLSTIMVLQTGFRNQNKQNLIAQFQAVTSGANSFIGGLLLTTSLVFLLPESYKLRYSSGSSYNGVNIDETITIQQLDSEYPWLFSIFCFSFVVVSIITQYYSYDKALLQIILQDLLILNSNVESISSQNNQFNQIINNRLNDFYNSNYTRYHAGNQKKKEQQIPSSSDEEKSVIGFYPTQTHNQNQYTYAYNFTYHPNNTQTQNPNQQHNFNHNNHSHLYFQNNNNNNNASDAPFNFQNKLPKEKEATQESDSSQPRNSNNNNNNATQEGESSYPNNDNENEQGQGQASQIFLNFQQKKYQQQESMVIDQKAKIVVQDKNQENLTQQGIRYSQNDMISQKRIRASRKIFSKKYVGEYQYIFYSISSVIQCSSVGLMPNFLSALTLSILVIIHKWLEILIIQSSIKISQPLLLGPKRSSSQFILLYLISILFGISFGWVALAYFTNLVKAAIMSASAGSFLSLSVHDLLRAEMNYGTSKRIFKSLLFFSSVILVSLGWYAQTRA